MALMIFHKWLKLSYRLHVRYVRRAKEPRTTLLFLHGLGDSGAMWDKVIVKLFQDISLVVVDLLGAGRSPRPAWAAYDAYEQARSLFWTYRRLRLRGKVIVVGHSLGALVAVDFARHRPRLVRSLILCSPPIYQRPGNARFFKRPDDVLRLLYTQASKDSDRLISLYALARKIGVGDREHALDKDNIDTFIATLRSSIINQKTIDDIPRIKQPIRILHGVLDPFVVRSTLSRLAKARPNITLSDVPAAHTIRGPYVKKLVDMVNKEITQ